MSDYELWLTDDAGRPLKLLTNVAFFTYSRSTKGYGTVQFGLPYNEYIKGLAILFQPDWRIDIWRSPAPGFPKRRECSYFLRSWEAYDRSDGMHMIQFWGRNARDILRRWSVVTATESYWKKTDYIDDMMKEIVTESFITTPRVVPVGEFTVEGDQSLGPSIPHTFKGKNVLEVLKELKDISFAKNTASPTTNKRIFFDVIEAQENGLAGGFGYVFRTYANLRGMDRTGGLIFSVENGNFKDGTYREDYLDEITEAQVGVTSVTNSSEYYLSRWNRILQFQSSSDTAGEQTSKANEMLGAGAAKKTLNGTFLNTPGNSKQPRSLYGVDWDLGDLVRAQHAGKDFNVEIEIVWASVNEDGTETVSGSTMVNQNE